MESSEKLEKDNKELIEMLEKLLDAYICVKMSTKYSEGLDEAVIARFINGKKKEKKPLN